MGQAGGLVIDYEVDENREMSKAICSGSGSVVEAYHQYASLLRVCAPCQRTYYKAVRILAFYMTIKFDAERRVVGRDFPDY